MWIRTVAWRKSKIFIGSPSGGIAFGHFASCRQPRFPPAPEHIDPPLSPQTSEACLKISCSRA